jgi:hypothetical protein
MQRSAEDFYQGGMIKIKGSPANKLSPALQLEWLIAAQ